MVNRIKLLHELEKYPVFTTNTLCSLTGKGKKYCWLVTHRLKKAGLIFEIERDKYTVHADPLLVASHITWPCYLSCWTAVRHYNLTEQLPTSVQAVTTRPKKRRKIKFGNASIEFLKIKKEFFSGFRKIKRGEFEVFMAEQEKALADAVHFKRMSFETLAEIVAGHKRELSLKKLFSHFKKMNMEKTSFRLKEELKKC